MKRFIAIICLTVFSHLGYTQVRDTILVYNAIDSIDSGLICILNNHINNTEKFGGFIFSDDCLHLIFIYPALDSSMGLSHYFIDSIYSNNYFPPNYGTPGYKVVVYSLSNSDPFLRTLNYYSTIYSSSIEDREVILLSNLELDFNRYAINYPIICSSSEKDYQEAVFTTYSYRYYDIYQTSFQVLHKCRYILNKTSNNGPP